MTGGFGACPVVANRILFVGDDPGNLNALKTTIGATIWSFKPGAYSMISSSCDVDCNGQVYHGGNSGGQEYLYRKSAFHQPFDILAGKIVHLFAKT